ncbi:tRNA lysidine(34) synthetase TilS [Ferrimonas gelatinilytica]|uniref:tRNA(Ile)-lysidine synthase n=1 Tax=Ferrimonas gelatinilytica TaxID=1255257 RepID=A0ABP9S4Q7_9GAMM
MVGLSDAAVAQLETALATALAGEGVDASSAQHGGRVWLAYSGGVDSQLMATLLARWQQRQPQRSCALLHVHHGLSEHADGWELHCRRSAERLGLPLTVSRVQLALKSRISVEAAARDARYAAFLSHLGPKDILLTGHHLDDQAETLLLALKRGSGPKGLASMSRRRALGDATLLRPWLGIPRVIIERAAQSLGLTHIEDDSNADTRFDRNFLRHRVLPELEQRWPGFRRNLARSAELCAEQQHLCDELARSDLDAVARPCGGLSVSAIASLSAERRNNLLRYWLGTRGGVMPTRAQLAQMAQLWEAREDAQPQIAWEGGELRRYRDGIYLLRAPLPVLPKRETLPLLAHWLDASALSEPGSPAPEWALANGEQWCGQRCHQGERLMLPRPGQAVSVRYGLSGSTRLRPLGRSGSRSLKKLWQEYGVPPWQRDGIAMLCYDDEVVAALGLWLEQSALAESGVGWVPVRVE